MTYIVWQKEQFGENWRRYDCATEKELEDTILQLLRQEGDIVVTVAKMYKVNIKLTEAPVDLPARQPKSSKQLEIASQKEENVEASQGGSEKDQDPGAKSKSQV